MKKFENLSRASLHVNEIILNSRKELIMKLKESGTLEPDVIEYLEKSLKRLLRSHDIANEQFENDSNIGDKLEIPKEELEMLVSSVGFNLIRSANLGDVIVISGPSGVGKDTVIKKILDNHPEITKAVSVTTRKMRPGESEGVDYHYVSRAGYEKMLDLQLLIDKAEFAGNKYGVPKSELRKRIINEALIVNALPETGRIFKQLVPETKSIIIMPPSIEEQFRRLSVRGTESEEKILERIKADKELFKDFESVGDYVLISQDGQVDKLVEEIRKIIKSK